MTRAGKYQKLPTKWADREKLREKGQFWTPGWVAGAMVRYAIGNGSKLLFDPAAGRGAFLNALRSFGAESKGVQFYGTDIDSAVLDDAVYRAPGNLVEKRDFIHNPPTASFDSIVANPPYIRHHRLSAGTKAMLQSIARRNLGRSIDGRAGLHVFFFIQALERLAPGGRLAFIMPADTCEGVFSQALWKWVTSKYCLEAVISFAPEATPFPGVDTNAMIFMIRRVGALEKLHWIRCGAADSPDLIRLVEANFCDRSLPSLEVSKRNLKEAVRTGLSRPAIGSHFRFTLSDFARVMRGIATGANDFFWMTEERAAALGIPRNMLKSAVGRTRDVSGDSITCNDLRELNERGRPTLLFSPEAESLDQFPENVRAYLELGERQGLPGRALIRTRKPWFRMEKREIPPFLFAYLGRRNTRFIRNHADVIPLTGFLCVYPHRYFMERTDELWEILSAPETVHNLSLVGKSYGSGAIKVEPRSLERLPIPDDLIESTGLVPPHSARSGNPLLPEINP